MISKDQIPRIVTNNKNYMEDHADRLAENGYNFLPIIPSQKCPGDYSFGKWKGKFGWEKYCGRQPTSFELRAWKSWPGCGVGIACGAVCAVDIDIEDDKDVSFKVQQIAFEMLGETSAIRIGKFPKRLLVYKARDPFQKFRVGSIEILAKGSQFVAHGIHPDTGKEYQWVDEHLTDIHIDDLPEVTEAQIRKFIEHVKTQIPAEMFGFRLGPDMSDARAEHVNPRGTYEAVSLALEYIPNPDLHYDDWVRIGMAVKASDIGNEDFDLFDEWSSQSSKYDSEFTWKTWQGLKPRGEVGAGTIYYYAERHGWMKPFDLILNGDEKDELEAADGVDGAAIVKAILDSAAKKAPKPAPEAQSMPQKKSQRPIPAEIFQLSGALKDMVEWVTKTANKPQPFLALGASLAALGAAMGRRYATPTDLRSNVYVVGVAASGSGKEHARRCTRDLFHHAGIEPMIGGDRIASGPAIATALKRSPSVIFQLDEFGNMLRAIMGQANPPKHLAEIMTNLTQLATSASSVFAGTEYANPMEVQKKKKKNSAFDDDDEDDMPPPPTTIINPHVCINATTTPGQFWEALRGGAIADGSIARYLIFSTDQNYPDSQFNPSSDPPQRLTDKVKAMATAQAGHGIASITAYNIAPTPRVVPYGDGAEDFVLALDRKQTARLREHEMSPLAAIIARTLEHTLKIGLIAAVSDDPYDPVIERRHLEWASWVVDHCISDVLTAARDEIADTGTESAKKRLLNVIRDAGGSIGKRELTRKTQNLRAREREEYLKDLIDAGMVAQEINLSSDRAAQKVVSYKLVD